MSRFWPRRFSFHRRPDLKTKESAAKVYKVQPKREKNKARKTKAPKQETHDDTGAVDLGLAGPAAGDGPPLILEARGLFWGAVSQ